MTALHHDSAPGAAPAPPAEPRPAPAPARVPRLAAASGAAFVVCVLAGNSLTESVSGTGALGGLAALAGSTTARAGLVVELVAFVLLLVFVGVLATLPRREGGARSTAQGVLAVAGTTMVAVKLGSAAAVLGALHARDDLDESAATALVESNGAAFVLFWIPFGLFVLAAARMLMADGRIGRVLGTAGLVLGGLGIPVGILGAVSPALAVPVPFLLSLLWVAAVSVRLAVTRRPRDAA